MNIKVSFEDAVTSQFTETSNILLGKYNRTTVVHKCIVPFQFKVLETVHF